MLPTWLSISSVIDELEVTSVLTLLFFDFFFDQSAKPSYILKYHKNEYFFFPKVHSNPPGMFVFTSWEVIITTSVVFKSLCFEQDDVPFLQKNKLLTTSKKLWIKNAHQWVYAFLLNFWSCCTLNSYIFLHCCIVLQYFIHAALLILCKKIKIIKFTINTEASAIASGMFSH